MGTGWLSHVGEWASAWPAVLWRASWQGALCAALVWAVARAWPRMPASLRAGLWWMVALKFVVSLGGLKPVPLPLLPAPGDTVAVHGPHRESVHLPTGGPAFLEPSGVSAASPRVAASPGATGVPARSGAALTGGMASSESSGAANPALTGGLASSASSGGASPALTGGRASSESSGAAGLPALASRGLTGVSHAGEEDSSSGLSALLAAAMPWLRILMLVLLGVWAVGVLWHVRSHVKGWTTVRRVRRSARLLEHPVLESAVRELSHAAGLRRVPALLVSESVASPLATGLVSPVVMLPAKAVRRLPVEALRMALAHELAHLRRGDLWLGWVPALAEALLFFHPLARRAAREYALAREEACDAEALHLTGAEPADYGELLLAFGVARAPGTAAALGASAHVQALHRRLSMLEHVEAVPAHPRRLLKVALSALGLAALVPFQVVAQEAASQTKPAPADGTAPAAASQAKPAAPAAGSAPAASQAKPAAPATASQAKPAAGTAQTASQAEPSAESRVRPAAPAAPPAPRVAGVPAVPPVPPAPRVGALPPIPPMPRLAAIPRMPVMPRIAAAVPPVPRPPSLHDDDDNAYVLLSDNRAMMNGSSVDLNLARMFQKKGGELLYVRRNGEAFIIRDPATLKAVHTALEPTRELGNAQGDLGGKQGALGEKQGALGEKQGELGQKQGELGLKQAELAHKQAGLNLEEMRLDSLPEAERDRRRAELQNQERALDKEMEAIEKQMEALGEQMEALGREQEKLGEQQEKLGEEQEKLGEQMEAKVREAEKKVQSLIDEALKKGLGQPLPT